MSRLLAVSLCAGLALSGCDDNADAQVQWFDPGDLLDNLRAEDQRTAARAVAPLSLDQLPLYDLDLRVSDDQSSFEMAEEIYFTNTTGRPLESVVLRLYANAVGDRAQVSLTGSRCIGASCQVAWDRRSVFEVRPSEALAPGGRLRIRLDLRGELKAIDPARTGMLAQAMESMSRMGNGSEHGDYGLLAHGSGVASMGNFYAMVAPFREGAWVRAEGNTMGDLGADGISHFRARIRAAPGSRVAVTGKILRERTTLAQSGQPGSTEVNAVAGMTRNFAIVLGRDIEVASARVGVVDVHSWFLPADRAAGEAALDTAVHSLRTFERRFGRYPYTDLEVVEAPLVGGAGGVEFSGLVTVATMFYQPLGSGMGLGALGGMGNLGGIGDLLGGGGAGGGGAGNPMAGMQDSMLEFVVSHEVAHQWWHGIVGSDAREHPFVDESLAQFSSMLYVRDRYGAERAEQEAQRQVASNYHMMRLRGAVDGAVDRPIDGFDDEMAYAGLVYGKGPFLYPELREALGDRAFFRGVSAYVADHRFKVAAPRALFDRLARGQHAQRVRGLERHWLDEAHGDEDLGQPDMARMMGQWMGNGSDMGPLMDALRGITGGQGGQGGLGGLGLPSGGAGSADTDAALQEVLRGLQQMQSP